MVKIWDKEGRGKLLDGEDMGRVGKIWDEEGRGKILDGEDMGRVGKILDEEGMGIIRWIRYRKVGLRYRLKNLWEEH